MFFCVHWTDPILEIKSTTKAYIIQLFLKKLNSIVFSMSLKEWLWFNKQANKRTEITATHV